MVQFANRYLACTRKGREGETVVSMTQVRDMSWRGREDCFIPFAEAEVVHRGLTSELIATTRGDHFMVRAPPAPPAPPHPPPSPAPAFSPAPPPPPPPPPPLIALREDAHLRGREKRKAGPPLNYERNSGQVQEFPELLDLVKSKLEA
jgi:hypothetical protein